MPSWQDDPPYDPSGIDGEVRPDKYGEPGCGAVVLAILVIGLLIYAVLTVAF